MLFYIFFIITEFVLLTNRGRQKNISYLIAFWIMGIISIIRFDVGYDYPTYYNFYFSNSSLEDYDQVESLEPLSQLIVKISRFLGSPYWIMTIYGLLTYFFLYISLDKYEYKSFALLIYLCFLWLSSLNLLRQSLAVCILLYAYKYVIQKKLLKYIVFVVLATLFHSSAIIGILVYFVFHKCTIKTLIIFACLSIIISSIVYSWMSSVGLYTYVIENSLETQSGDKLVLFYLLFYTLTVSLYYNNKKCHDAIVLKTLLVISVSFIFFITIQAMSAWRIGLYFISLYIFVLPKILAVYSAKTKLLISLLLVSFFIVTLVISTKSARSPYIPYDILFNHLETNNQHFRF